MTAVGQKQPPVEINQPAKPTTLFLQIATSKMLVEARLRKSRSEIVIQKVVELIRPEVAGFE